MTIGWRIIRGLSSFLTVGSLLAHSWSYAALFGVIRLLFYIFPKIRSGFQA
jgi:hypothetical protein